MPYICPVFSDSKSDVECCGDSCAWWNEGNDNCWFVQGVINVFSLRKSVQDLVVTLGGEVGCSKEALEHQNNRTYKAR